LHTEIVLNKGEWRWCVIVNYKEKNEDDVWQILNHNIYKLFCLGALNAGVFVAMVNYKEMNEDDVWQILNYDIYKLLCLGASNAGIFVAMSQQCDGPGTVKMGSCFIEKDENWDSLVLGFFF